MAQPIVVNNPGVTKSGMGFFAGILLLGLLALLFFVYGLPALRNSLNSPAVSVPEQIDVNVQRR